MNMEIELEKQFEIEPVKEEPFSPDSPEDLRQKLEESGILEQTSQDKDGTAIVWSDFKIQKLYKDYENGERTFSIARYPKPDEEGEFIERVETSQQSIRAHVYYTDAVGDRYKLVQYFYTKTELRDSEQNVTDSENSELIRKTSESSVSGKLKHGDFTETLAEEMQEELGLSPDDYEIASTSDPIKEKQMSVGYPGLLTHFTFVKYDIDIKPEAWKQEYVEIGIPIVTDGSTETPVNVFRWEKV